MSSLTTTAKLPAWARWCSIAWLVVWIPVYWRFWGPGNFLHVCDIAVILTCLGLWFSDSLLLSSQAVASIFPDLLWDLDAAWRLFTGHPLTGGTDYMWDAHYPLWVRLLSLFHIVWPIILLLALARTGYDRRGFSLQSAIAAAALIAARFCNPALNINYAFRNPFTGTQIGSAPVYVSLVWLALVLALYLPVHLALAKTFPAAPRLPR